jgi:hypothetical protein
MYGAIVPSARESLVTLDAFYGFLLFVTPILG